MSSAAPSTPPPISPVENTPLDTPSREDVFHTPAAEPPTSPLDTADSANVNDPPPPYPSRERRRRRHTRTGTSLASNEEAVLTPIATHYGDVQGDEQEPTETTPFLSPGLSRRGGRPRSYSHTSTLSAAPSLARTVLSLFDTTADPEDTSDSTHPEPEEDEQLCPPDSERPPLSPLRHGDEDDLSEYDVPASSIRRSKGGLLSASGWKRYFRPLGRAPYYKALFHLLVLNFPYALAAWVYLFVFTVTGTTLLVALPLGAVLCFFNLLGARAFARGELTLQTTFHSPLAHPSPSPPRPIFTRLREPTAAEIEAGTARRGGLVWEKSFYKNTYAMFTDPTSYQSLFYFLVIKPAITIIFSLLLLVVAVPVMALVLPAPAVLRAVRRLGKWQANVAIEGLYMAVR